MFSSRRTPRRISAIAAAELEIVVDKDTFRAGQTAPVMIDRCRKRSLCSFQRRRGRPVSYQAGPRYRKQQNSFELPIEEKHIPNVFLTALMVSDAQLSSTLNKSLCRPSSQFLAVAVKADREQYQPREEGTLSISTRDANGRPVSAEVALGLVDESVNTFSRTMPEIRASSITGRNGRTRANSKHVQAKDVTRDLVEDG